MIKYAVISRGSLILADYTELDTDFASISKKILAKQNKNQQKQLFLKDDFMFCFCGHQEYSFLTVTDNQEQLKQVAFQFLDQLKEQFKQELEFGKDLENSGKSQQAVLSLLIKNMMEEYNKGEAVAKQLQNLAKLEKDLEAVNDIAKQSIGKISNYLFQIQLENSGLCVLAINSAIHLTHQYLYGFQKLK